MKIGIAMNGRRDEYIKALLTKEHEVERLNENNLIKQKFDVLIFGIKSLDIGIAFGTLVLDEKIWEKIDTGTKIVCGKASKRIKERYDTFCLLEVESYLNENARITAYGILSMLLEHCPRLITEMTVDIVGFGHCGKEIVHLLEQLEVSVRIITKGICDTNFECLLYEDWKYVEPSDVIINTAPAVVINEYDCGRWKKDPIIIDLSTGHIGVAEVVRNCIQVIDAPALPDIIGCQSAAFCYYQHLIRWLT